MNILCTSSRIVSRQRPEQGIQQIMDAGFQAGFLDLAAYISAKELEWFGKPDKPLKKNTVTGQLADRKNQEVLFSEHLEDFQAFLATLHGRYDKAGLQAPIAQAPYLSAHTERDDLQKLLLEIARISIESCGEAGCKAVIVKPLFAGMRSEVIWEENRTYYLSLAETARKYGVTILLENQLKNIHGRLGRGICAEPEEATEWVDVLNGETGEERFGFCMDIGVCNICGQNMHDFIRSLGSRLKAAIIRDCDGLHDAALLPFSCAEKGRQQTNWKSLIWGLRDVSFDGSLILDFSDTIAGFSPLMRSQVLQLAKSLGDYLAWQAGMERAMHKYRQHVLFGAGNMCRNYMEHYGSKNPPLFTCDNNSRLWGTDFCGLEVSSPQRLKSLPEDCAIFICNTFYKEIAKQLQDMGLANPIVYFNDEYLPEFTDFDILEKKSGQ